MRSVLIPAFLLVLQFGYCLSQSNLLQDPMYFIVGPRKVTPGMVVRISITLLRLDQDQISIKASILNLKNELASVTTVMDRLTTRMVEMKMPDNAVPGQYIMRVDGFIENEGNIARLFKNETEIIFDTKQVAIFIQMNKLIYHQNQRVHFRIVPVKQNLMAALGTVDVYIYDATNSIVRRWMSQQTSLGVVELDFPLSEQPHYGVWKVVLDAFGSKYEKQFRVIEFWEPRFQVNVTMPAYINTDGLGLPVRISANHTSGYPVHGNGTVYVTLRYTVDPNDPSNPNQVSTQNQNNQNKQLKVLQRDMPYFKGRYDMYFSLEELKRETGVDTLTDYEIWVNATVRDWFWLENHTSHAYSYVYGSQIIIEFLGDQVRTFKPGMPYKAYLAVSRLDGSPLRQTDDRTIILHRTTSTFGGGAQPGGYEEKFTLPDDGILEYNFIPPKTAHYLSIKARYDRDRNIQTEQTAVKVFSPSDSYLQISTTTHNAMVGRYIVFKVECTDYVQFINYMIVAGGRVLLGDQLNMNGRTKTFAVALSQDMVPQAHVLVYYIRQDREVVVDALNFFVNGTRIYEIDIQFNWGKDFIGDFLEFVGKTEPGTFISFSGIDWDQYSHGMNNFLTEEEVIDELAKFDLPANSSFSHRWNYNAYDRMTVYFPSPSYGVDANTTFIYSGLFAFSDANITKFPHNCNETLGFLPCFSSECYPSIKRCDGFRYCSDGADEVGCPKPPRAGAGRRKPDHYFNFLSRHFLPTDFMWKSEYIKPNGYVEFMADIPDQYPLMWVVSAFAMSKENGLGLMPKPKSFDATQPLVVVAETPEASQVGEQIGVRVTVCNWWNDYQEVFVTLHKSDKYRYVIVKEWGVVSSYRPTLTDEDWQTMIYLDYGQCGYLFLPVVPIVDGEIDIKVSAASFIASATITKKVHVTYYGVTVHYFTPYLLNLIRTGSSYMPPLVIEVPEQFVGPEEMEHLYVPGSPRARVSVVGDIVGPGFYKDQITALDLIDLPYGNGEAALYNLATNVYMLKFLQETSSPSRKTSKDALEFMNVALQRVLSYYNSTEGSFKVFRDDHVASVWVTSFAVRVLDEAKKPEWEYDFFISSDLLNKIMKWICNQQQPDGSFIETAPVYDVKQKPQKNAQKSHVILTAQAVIGLSRDRQIKDAKAIVLETRNKAAKFLFSKINSLTDVYEAAIVAYALNQAKHPKALDAYQKLMFMKREDGNYLYWADTIMEPGKVEVLETKPYIKPDDPWPNEGRAVEATSYALLTMLASNERWRALGVVQWLTSMRDHIGGFASTSDSIIAQIALTEYARKDESRNLFNMKVRITANAHDTWRHYMEMDNKNFGEMQSVYLPKPVWGYVDLLLEGTGLITVMLDTWKNVEYRRYMRFPHNNERYFDIFMKDTVAYGRNVSIIDFNICTKWVRPDLAPRSGMALVTINTPSGYLVLNSTLREIVRSEKYRQLKRAMFFRGQAHFYFEYLDTQDNCFMFRVDRWYPIANISVEHKMKVMDYYEPGRFNDSLYRTYDLFSLDMCQVCGSYQCPYCPFFNLATTINISFTVLLTSLLFTLAHFCINRHARYNT